MLPEDGAPSREYAFVYVYRETGLYAERIMRDVSETISRAISSFSRDVCRIDAKYFRLTVNGVIVLQFIPGSAT